MKSIKSSLVYAILGLAIQSSVGCSNRPISAAQAHAADELDLTNKTLATDPRNKMAAHGLR